MKKLGIKLDFETSTIHWKGQSSPMKPLLSPQRQSRFQQVQQQFLASLEDKADSIGPQGLEFETNFFTSLKLNESEYQKHEVDEVAAKQTHLTAAQQQELKLLRRKFTKLFSGKLGSYPHRKMHLDVDRQALKRLFYQRPYPIPHVNYDVFYQELQRLVELGVLEEVKGLVDFAAPTFLVPKKDANRVRWVSDFRELNKIIRRRVYPLPHINKILRKRKGYKWFTKLDISMQYYTFELDDDSKELCVISTPFGNYRYVCQSPNGRQTDTRLCSASHGRGSS